MRKYKIISLCLMFGLLICALAYSQTKNEESIKSLIAYLDLKNVSANDVAHLSELKDNAEKPGLTTEQRKSAYHELFENIGKLQGSPPQFIDFYANAATSWYCQEPRIEKKETARPGELGAVVKHGTGKIPVILIPDVAFTAHLFDSFAQRNEKNYVMYAITLPGFGGTPAPAPFEHRDYAQLRLWKNAEEGVLQLIKKENLKHPWIIGMQGGAYLALRVALDYPERVGGVVVLNGLLYAPMQLSGPPKPISKEKRAAASKMFGPVELLPLPSESCYGKYLKIYATYYSKDAELGNAAAQDAAKSEPHLSWDYFSELLTTDLSDEIGKLKMPLLVIPSIPDANAPGKTPGDPVSLYQWKDLKMPNLKIVPLKDTRAFATVDNPQLLDQTISEFINAH